MIWCLIQTKKEITHIKWCILWITLDTDFFKKQIKIYLSKAPRILWVKFECFSIFLFNVFFLPGDMNIFVYFHMLSG